MADVNRTAIYSALWAKLQGAYAWVSSNRVWHHWDNVANTEQPALFMMRQGEVSSPSQLEFGTPHLKTLMVDVYVYDWHQPGEIPSDLCDIYLKAIEDALKPDNVLQRRQTLGGLCQHCFIEGQTDISEGVLGEQLVIIIPVKILATLSQQ